ncbi:translocation/assembly module TamB domain-containing protein [Jannaschia sp. M317]|uniref:translocation/assembly module TamB domain-containing protein n=1 Tax=Jannaschia sp. M317 TaxID=2867011 RepID=UPI0021A60FD5|nr:translocation/assembly module TamB domain-containing protein [Jannaschia sp. M317]UWQ18990.1 translocation/assembly module TamB domain-containing protein [Jannaschia sp. M317]
MRALPLALTLALTLALPAAAQDAAEERDRSFLTALIEDNLSAPGLSVRIDGFEGALSSEASLDVLTISDDAGPWLRLEEVVLDWNRSALLRGRLEVEQLTAALIAVERTPLPPEGVEALPEAGASGFSLPNLPVSVDIGLIRAERIDLGAAILGQALSLRLEATAQLADGSGQVDLTGERLDGVAGTFDIEAGFDAETKILSVDLDVREAEGGLASGLLQLPGAPAIELTVTGTGPLDDFAADIAVASDGADRLSGQVTLAGVEDGRRFAADLGGDLTALLAPRYRPFFGDDVGLRVVGVALDAGGTLLQELDISTQALTLGGTAEVGADGWPRALDVTGRIASADGTRVLLPTADAISLAGADFALRHDAQAGEDWLLDLSVEALDHPALTLDRGYVTARGTVDRSDGSVIGANGLIEAALDGIGWIDPALADAIGAQVTLGAQVGWAEGGPVRITDLALEGPALTASGAVDYALDGRALPVTLDLRAEVGALSRLSALTGLDLGGAAALEVSGDLTPVGGAFDLSARGAAEGLRTGIAQADGLLQGRTALSLAARRDETGTYLDALSLENPQVALSGTARILAEDAPARTEGQTGQATLDLTVADGGVVDPRLTGPLSARVALSEDDAGAWAGNAEITAPQGVSATAAGRLTGPTPDLDFTLSVPEIGAFVDGVPGALTAEGRAFAEDGIWSVDANLAGPWGLVAEVAGPVTGDAVTITYSARLPDVTAPVPALAALPALAGPVELSGKITQEGAALVTDTQVTAPEGVTLRLRGPVTGPAPRLEMAATVPRLQVLVPQVEGTLSLDALLARAGEEWTLEARARGPEGTRATVETVLTDTPLAVDFTLDVPRLAAFAAGVPGGLDLSGMAVQAEDGWRVDLDGTGPYAATLNASARLPDAGPEVTLTARIPDATRIAPQLRGALTVEAEARQRGGVWSADVEASGPLGARVTANARLPDSGAEVTAALRMPNAATLSPALRGPLNLDLTATERGGVWRADVDASGPFGADLDVSGVVFGGPVDVDVAFAVPDISPLVPDISGPLRVSGRVTQPGSDYRLDLSLTGPAGTAAQVAGTVATDATLTLSVSGSAPLGLANAAVAPRRLGGTASFDLRVAGPPALDSVTGTIRTTNGAVSLPTLRNGLEPLVATVTLQNGRAVVDAQATLQTGGQVQVSGPVDLSAPFNANLRAQFAVTLEDPTLYTANVSGDVAVTGPLTGGAVISGQVLLDGAEIAVPSSGLTAIGDLPPIDHLATPRPVQRTLARAGQDAKAVRAEKQASSGPGFGLDLRVDAPGRIFVRGRGLDAELGGSLRVTGTTNAPVTAGAFELVRGRLDILQQRFDLDEGTISFQGDLIPYIRLVAITETDALTASIAVEGPADSIEVSFGSSPDVPQEEILAQIFFGRDLSQLSPLQALQLANSIAVLAGRGSGGLLEKLRGNAGLDDLDVTTDSDGNTAVRAGKYISDNVYTDVEIDQSGDATISLNLDLTPNLTVRGATGASGESSLGIFFEKDY